MDADVSLSGPAWSALPDLHTMVFNSLNEQIAVIDQTGTIVDVNSAWIRFGVDNGLSSDYAWMGRNYLKALTTSHTSGDALAGEAANGILDMVEDRRTSFRLEYPCHSLDEKRWFMMVATHLKVDSRRLFAISHHNITQRKLAEERSEYLAMHDPLTGLANRRYFSLTFDREFRASMRERSPISLISVDIDHFKDYNDECGHLAGDDCLAQVGHAILAFSRRPNDLAARVGGDEFAVLLGNTDVVESQRLAEAIVKSISDLEIVYGSSKKITVTAGVASLIPRPRETNEHLLHEADKALYRAKGAGRNRAVHADSFD
jgi:diguanylate cyclase (GGDEF)-like protein